MKDSVDTQLQGQQIRFHKDRSCTERNTTIQIIAEQSIEWNLSRYINSPDHEEALDRVDRRTSWNRLQHYGVLEKTVNIIRRKTLLIRAWKTADRRIPSEDWRQTKMITLTLSISSGGRLDREDLDI
ncbi:unnamed protein product [Schistosoma curassoni]|uniref:Reverse transcriptase n=1 Tax=Schistosoma curassoni TaxID=6186 RepID=A0A183JRG4_9TREM|nr:unnamed protein product [Schistosoma curassoni]